jgi:hypothetical protein
MCTEEKLSEKGRKEFWNFFFVRQSMFDYSCEKFQKTFFCQVFGQPYLISMKNTDQASLVFKASDR